MTGGKHVIVGGLGNLGRFMQQTLLKHGVQQIVVVDCVPYSKGRDTIIQQGLVHPSIQYKSFALGDPNAMHLLPTLQEALTDADTVYSMVTPNILTSTVRDMKRTIAKV